MTDPTTFLNRLRRIRLSDNERLATRERLALYASMHPVMAPEASMLSPFTTLFTSRRFSVYAGALIALVVIGGGVTFAAEGSVPGDTLYAIKIHVNEPVMTALAAGPTGQAQVAASLATRRVDEAVTLASRGDLTPARQTYLAQQFTAQVAIADQKTGTLAQTDSAAAVRVNDEFASSLAGEAQALGAVASTHDGQAVDLLSTVVATTQNLSETADSGDTSVVVSGVTESSSTTTSASVGTTTTSKTPTRIESTSPPTAFSIHRFSRYLRIASTTLRVQQTNATSTESALPPAHAFDLSIPSIGASSASAAPAPSTAASLNTSLGD